MFINLEVGVLELNRNPQNHFAEVEQAAFGPGNPPPGLGASPNRMLQARLKADPVYGEGVARELGIKVGETAA